MNIITTISIPLYLAMYHFLIALFLVPYGIYPVDCYNYLVISPVYGFSHMKFMAAIANQLAENGHRVTYFQPFQIEAYQNHTLIKHDSIEIVNYYLDEEGRKHMPPSNDLADAWWNGKYQSGLATAFEMPEVLSSHFEHMCRKIFLDEELHKVLRKKKFDVTFAETFDFCGLYLADYLDSSSIISVFTGSRIVSIEAPLGEPSWIHYSPSPSVKAFGPDASIFDRLNDLWHKYVFGSGYARLFDWQFYQISRLTDGKVRHWKQILQDVTFHFSNSNPYLDFPVPTISKVISIGGFDIEQTNIEKLPDKLNNILNLRKYNVFVSFGSMVKSKLMPNSYKKSMLKLFSANIGNCTFLWKYEDPNELMSSHDVSSNVYLKEWFPQRALLADKRINLFITHGGLGSTMELAYQAQPAIVIPLIAEQPDNAQMLHRHKSAEIFSKHDIPNWQLLNALVQKMLSTDSYQKSSDRLARLLSKQPIKPRQLMLSHAEMAAEFGTLPELSPVVQNMGLIEFYNLDIIAVFLIVLMFFVWKFTRGYWSVAIGKFKSE